MTRILFVALALTLLCACAAPASVTETPPSNQAAAAATEAEPEKIVALAVQSGEAPNPYTQFDSCSRLVASFCYEPLYRVSAEGETTGVLAEACHTSSDGLTTTVTIRSGLTFSDGTALTAAHVANSLKKAAQSPYYSSRLQGITVVDAKGNSLVLRTDKAAGCLPRRLDFPVTLGENPMLGTAPYVFSGDRLTANLYWRGQDFPVSAREISLVPVTDMDGLRDSFQFGQVSLLEMDPNGAVQVTVQGDYELWSRPTAVLEYIGFNLNSSVCKDGKFRNGVCHAVDRESIVTRDMGGFGTAVTQAALPGSAAAAPEIGSSVTYDLSVLESAGAGKTVTMLVSSGSPQRIASAGRVAAALRQAGVAVTLKTLEHEAYTKALENGAFDLYYGEVRLSPDQDLSPLFTPGSGACFGGLGLTELQELCDRVRADDGNAYDLQKAIYTDSLLCPIAFKQEALYVRRGLVASLAPGLTDWIGGF